MYEDGRHKNERCDRANGREKLDRGEIFAVVPGAFERLVIV